MLRRSGPCSKRGGSEWLRWPAFCPVGVYSAIQDAADGEVMPQDAQHTHVMATHPLFTGSGLAVLSLPLHLFLPAQTSVLLAALTLALIAGVYLGFAFVDGRLSVMTTELC